MTWHYIFVKLNPRLLKYQLLTAHTHAATVEDQYGWRRGLFNQSPALGNPVQRGHRFQRKADSNPVIADSR